MVDKAADKKDFYFGIVPKEAIKPFFEDVKKNLAEIPKEGEKKNFKFEITGTKEEPKGISSETFSVTKENYANFFDDSKDYMKDIASVCSISISANDEASVAVLEGLFNQFKPVIDEIPQVKKKISEGKVAYFYRAAGTKLFIDVVTKEGKIINPLLDMNIDFKEFQTFKASFKTDFVPSDFFNCSIEQIAEKFLKLVLCIEGETTNGKYLALSILKALEKVKLPNEKFQKKLQKAVTFLHFIVAFVQANFLLEFAPKEVSQNILTNALKEIFQTEDVNAQFEGMKVMAEQLGGQMIKPTLENMQMLDAAKAANIDEISLAWATPKYQGGIAHVVKLPGVTIMINEKFLA